MVPPWPLALATDAAFPRCALAKKRRPEEHTPTFCDFCRRASGASWIESMSWTHLPVKKPARTRPAEEEVVKILDSEGEEHSLMTVEV